MLDTLHSWSQEFNTDVNDLVATIPTVNNNVETTTTVATTATENFFENLVQVGDWRNSSTTGENIRTLPWRSVNYLMQLLFVVVLTPQDQSDVSDIDSEAERQALAEEGNKPKSKARKPKDPSEVGKVKLLLFLFFFHIILLHHSSPSLFFFL